jgi:NitT/TauT family transport system substrate-binding protein
MIRPLWAICTLVVTVFLLVVMVTIFAFHDHAGHHPIRIGINPWPGYEPLFIARDRGLFAAHGLDVQLVEFSSVGDCLRGYQQGDIDGFCATLVEVEMAARRGRQGAPRIVIIPDTSNGADVILAHHPIRSVSELRGKRVGVEPAGLGMFILTRALMLNNVNVADIKLVALGQEEMAKGFATGQIDAAVTYSPYSVEMTKSGGVKIFSTAEIPGEVVDVMALSPTIASEVVVAKLQVVWSETLDLVARESEASFAVMAKRQNITIDEFKQSLEGIKFINRQDQQLLLAPGGTVERSQKLIREIFNQKQSP